MKPTKKGIVTFPYGVKYKSGAIHKGTDFRAAVGNPVYACVAGVVVHAGKHVYKKGWGLAFGVLFVFASAASAIFTVSVQRSLPVVPSSKVSPLALW